MERLKRKKEDDEKERLSAVFEQYRDEFEDAKLMHINQSFVRGEIVNADKTGPTLFQPSIKKPASAEEARRLAGDVAKRIMLEAQQKKVAIAIQTGSAPTTTSSLNKDNLPNNRPPKPGSKKDTQKTKMTNLELFKQELKQIQDIRQERRGLRDQLKQKFGDNIEAIDRIAPSLDNPYLQGNGEYMDDPTTTNLYLANLPGDIQLEDLYDTFGSFGPLASAKILYPRGDDDARKGPSLSGFIAYMSRIDAERAMSTMPGTKIRDCDIRVSWARPVVIPQAPFFVPQCLRELSMPDKPSGLPFNAQPQPSDLRRFLGKYRDLPQFGVPLPTDNPKMIDDYREMIRNSIIRVVVPTERPLLILIHRCIQFLIKNGPMFEACVMERERKNPIYRFLFDNNHPTSIYYRWKLFSLLNGETTTNWRIERFRMFQDGSWWEPPPHSLYSGSMPVQLYNRAYKPEKSSRVQLINRSRSNSPDKKKARLATQVEATHQKGILSSIDREHFENMLRDLTPEKSSIGTAMLWCLDHADCAKEIVQCLYESLDIEETPLHKKISRLYLINDILGNCSVKVKDVFYFRQYLQDSLEKIFVTLNSTLERIDSRIKAEQFRQRIMLCFRMLEDQAVYPRDFLIKLQNIFLGLVKPNEQTKESDDEDLDGVPLNLDDDEDLDGVPLNTVETTANPIKPKPSYESNHHELSNQGLSHHESRSDTDSKWNQDTLDTFTSKWDAPEQAERSVSKERKISKSSSQVSSSSKYNVEKNGSDEKIKLINDAREEEKRKLLREVEVKVVQYQDDLESENTTNIDKKLDDYRQKLMEKMETDLEEFEEGQIKYERKASRKRRDSSVTKKKRSRSRSREKRNRRSSSRDRHSSKHKERSRRSRSRERRSRSRSRDRRSRR